MFKIANEKTLEVLEETSKKNNQVGSFTFERIYNPYSTQLDLFYDVCLPQITDMIDYKKSGLIFAYGLTNSGKTYTIIGIFIIYI